MTAKVYQLDQELEAKVKKGYDSIHTTCVYLCHEYILVVSDTLFFLIF